jgi:hypothetical protein
VLLPAGWSFSDARWVLTLPATINLAVGLGATASLRSAVGVGTWFPWIAATLWMVAGAPYAFASTSTLFGFLSFLALHALGAILCFRALDLERDAQRSEDDVESVFD